METKSHIRSMGALLSDALGQLSKLFQIELALAKAEIKGELSKAIVGVGLLGAGVLMLIPAIVMALMAIAAALADNGFSPAAANLIAAVIGGIVAFALIAIAVARMQSMKLTPERTVDQLRKDRQTLSEVAR